MATYIDNTLEKKHSNNKKSFSLIELIVVLVIMAILAAALVPTLIGYIRQTRQSAAKNEAASVVTALQTIASSACASDDDTYYNKSDSTKNITLTNGYLSGDATCMDVAEDLAEVDGTVEDFAIVGGMVTYVIYSTTNGEYVLYDISAAEKYQVQYTMPSAPSVTETTT